MNSLKWHLPAIICYFAQNRCYILGTMRLSSRERDILLCGQLQADAPLSRIAKQTGHRIHSVRYAREKFDRIGLIHPYPYINIFALGFEEYGIFCSLAASRQIKQKILDSIKKEESVAWVLELSGNYNLGIAVCGRNSSATVKLLNALSEKYGDVLISKAISIRVSWTLFPRKYLSNRRFSKGTLSCAPIQSVQNLNESDHRILVALSNFPNASMREVAHRLNLPASSVLHRIKQLRASGVLVGFAYEIEPTVIGCQGYRLLLYTSQISSQLKQHLYLFCAAHRNVVALIECLGTWDFEIKAETESVDELQILVSDLYERFATNIKEIAVLTVLRTPKLSFYPFSENPAQLLGDRAGGAY